MHTSLVGKNVVTAVAVVWWLLKKLNKELPHDSTIPLLDIHHKEQKAETQTNSCMPIFIVALITIAKGENNPNVNEQMSA